jgi:hypothetical protein
VRRRDAVENDALYAVGMLARVDQIQPRSIRSAEESKFLIAERGTNVVKVVRRNRTGIEAQVCVRREPASAGLDERVRPQLHEIAFGMRRRREIALLWRGLSRPPVIHQQYVMLISEHADCAVGEGWSDLGRRSAGTSRVERDRTMRRMLGLDHDEVNRDRPPGFCDAVLVDHQRTAYRGCFARPHAARLRLKRRRHRMARGSHRKDERGSKPRASCAPRRSNTHHEPFHGVVKRTLGDVSAGVEITLGRSSGKLTGGAWQSRPQRCARGRSVRTRRARFVRGPSCLQIGSLQR